MIFTFLLLTIAMSPGREPSGDRRRRLGRCRRRDRVRARRRGRYHHYQSHRRRFHGRRLRHSIQKLGEQAASYISELPQCIFSAISWEGARFALLPGFPQHNTLLAPHPETRELKLGLRSSDLLLKRRVITTWAAVPGGSGGK